MALPLTAGGGNRVVIYEDSTSGALSPPIQTSGFQRMSLEWRERWTAPVSWDKYSANPVVPGEPTTPSIIEHGDEAKLYYGARPRIGVVVSPRSKFTQWTVRNPEVLVVGPAGAFDAAGVNAPEVVVITDKHWRMYYVGYHPTAKENGAPVHQIGLAESEDAGSTWRRVSREPVIPRGREGSYDAFSASSASVLKVGREWWLWYGGIAQVPYLASICLAISSDGVTFRKYEGNPVLRFNPHLPAEAFICAKPHVLFDQGVFRMWYTARGFGAQATPGDYRICYAESLDGIHWERYPENPVMTPSAAGWDRTMVEYAEVLRDGDMYHMLYCGDRYQSIGYATGSAARIEVRTRSGKSASPDDSWGGWSDPYRTPLGSAVATTAQYIQIGITTSGRASVRELRLTGERG